MLKKRIAPKARDAAVVKTRERKSWLGSEIEAKAKDGDGNALKIINSVESDRKKFDDEFIFRSLYPRENYHKGIQTAFGGIVIPAEIPPKDYRLYAKQINYLRDEHFSNTSLKRGRKSGTGYRMPDKIRRQVRKEFFRLVAGDDAARRSEELSSDRLKEYDKRLNWTAALRKLSKKYELSISKIRSAIFPA